VYHRIGMPALQTSGLSRTATQWEQWQNLRPRAKWIAASTLPSRRWFETGRQWYTAWDLVGSSRQGLKRCITAFFGFVGTSFVGVVAIA
jgi:hypothetical protein